MALLGARYTADDVRRIHAALITQEYSGIGDVFDALDGRGIACGVLSNTNPSHWQRLAGLDGGPPEYPAVLRAKHRLASFQLGRAKPDPAIYLAFMQHTGFAPTDILFFDDLQHNVDGARALGWRAERIIPGADAAEQMLAALRAHRVIPG